MERHFEDATVDEFLKRALWSLEEFVWLVFGYAWTVDGGGFPLVPESDENQRMDWLCMQMLRAVQVGEIDLIDPGQEPHEILASPKSWVTWAERNEVQIQRWMEKLVVQKGRQASRRPKSPKREALDLEIELEIEHYPQWPATRIAKNLVRARKNHGYTEGSIRKYVPEVKKNMEVE